MRTLHPFVLATVLCGAVYAGDWDAPADAPAATVDLATNDGAALMKAQWRYAEARVVDAEFFAPGADGQPGSEVSRAYDIAPKAGGARFDDSSWQTIVPADLSARRGGGKFSLNWYRVRLTVPERVGTFDTRGATLVLDVSVDDYAEVWVDGEIVRGTGQNGGSVIAGWNAHNRLVIGRNVAPGREIQLAIFGANGPLSNPPTNYVWFHEAKLELYPGDGEPVALPAARGQRRSRAARSRNGSRRRTESEGAQARGRIHLHRRTGMGAGRWRLSAIQRSERELDLQVHQCG